MAEYLGKPNTLVNGGKKGRACVSDDEGCGAVGRRLCGHGESRVGGAERGRGKATGRAARVRKARVPSRCPSRGARTRSSGSVGILVPDITSPFFPAVVQTVEHELAAAAIDVVLGDANNDVAVEARRLEMLLRRRVDALLVCPVDSRRSARALRSAASYVRLLQVDRWAIEEADFVGVDQLAGMSEIVEHLRSCGAESAVFAGLHEGMSSIVERAAAFETACQKLRRRSLAHGQPGCSERACGKGVCAEIDFSKEAACGGRLRQRRDRLRRPGRAACGRDCLPCGGVRDRLRRHPSSGADGADNRAPTPPRAGPGGGSATSA